MKEVLYVVNGSLEIHQTSVSDTDWKRGFCSAEIREGSLCVTVMVNKRGWNKFTNCAGFPNREEAEEFVGIIKAARDGDIPPKEISKRLQEKALGKCRACLYENKSWQFASHGHRCPVCGYGNIVYA